MIYPLTQNKVLAEALCFKGAYQSTNYYAVLDDKLSKVEQVLAEQYNEAGYDEKQGYAFVRGIYKGRVIGDCWNSEDAVWNGKILSALQSGQRDLVKVLRWRMAVTYFVSDIIVK